MPEKEYQFPYHLQNVTDLPEGFQRAIQTSLVPGDTIDSILMLPPMPFLRRHGAPRQALLSTTRGIVHVRDGKPPTADFLPGTSLLYVRHTLALLYGRLELAGEVDGKLVRVVAEYNTVGEELVEAELAHFLQMTYQAKESSSEIKEWNRAKLDELGEKSFKFMNGLQFHALRPGERLLGYVHQPRIQKPFLHFFQRPVAPETVFALTNQTLILIEEDMAWGASYGWVITLCPRNVVLTVESTPTDEWQNLLVSLIRNNVNTERNLILENETALDCKSLWASQIPLEREIQ